MWIKQTQIKMFNVFYLIFQTILRCSWKGHAQYVFKIIRKVENVKMNHGIVNFKVLFLNITHIVEWGTEKVSRFIYRNP